MTNQIRTFFSALFRGLSERLATPEPHHSETGYLSLDINDKRALFRTEFNASLLSDDGGGSVVDMLAYASSMACLSLAEEGGALLIGKRVRFRMRLDLEAVVDASDAEDDESTIPFTIDGIHEPILEKFLACLPDEDDDDPGSDPENVLKFRR